jgi:hypothetical protein
MHFLIWHVIFHNKYLTIPRAACRSLLSPSIIFRLSQKIGYKEEICRQFRQLERTLPQILNSIKHARTPTCTYTNDAGRATAQAVSRRVRARVRSRRICGGQSGTGVDLLRVHKFPQPNLIPPTAPHVSSIIRGWYNKPINGRRTK